MNFREQYDKVVKSDWFRKTYQGKSLGDIVKYDNNRFCSECCFSCCTSECIDTHPIDKDRWCHKLNKSVFDLEDANNCKYYFD